MPGVCVRPLGLGPAGDAHAGFRMVRGRAGLLLPKATGHWGPGFRGAVTGLGQWASSALHLLLGRGPHCGRRSRGPRVWLWDRRGPETSWGPVAPGRMFSVFQFSQI